MGLEAPGTGRKPMISVVKIQTLILQMETIKIAYYHFLAGEMMMGSYGDRICLCDWVENRRRGLTDRRICGSLSSVYEEGGSEIMDEAMLQLDEYFAGERKIFTIPILFTGTEFQCRVWNELMKISYGETVSYGEIAQRIQNPNAVRAVANAIATNPISILVPCHRVIGSDGKLTGYAGGIRAKQMLLDIESETLNS